MDDIIHRARSMQEAVNDLGAGKPPPIDVSIERMRSRAEALLTCPRCGGPRQCVRIGGGATSSRFQCRAYRFAPMQHNECRFVFSVSDRELTEAFPR